MILMDRDDELLSKYFVKNCQPNPHVRTINSFANIMSIGLFDGTI
jgi:hypothetical protein